MNPVKIEKKTTIRRRMAFAIFLMVLFWPSLAYAHPFVAPLVIQRAKTSSLNFAIYAEGNAPMVSSVLTVPSQFTVDSIAPPEGWKFTQHGNQVSLHGTPIPLGQQLVFTVTGTPSTLGVLEFPVTTIASDGAKVLWTGARESASPSKAPFVTVANHVSIKTSKPRSPLLFFIPAFVLIFGGAVFFGVRAVHSSRTRARPVTNRKRKKR